MEIVFQKIFCIVRVSVINGGWRKVEIPPYKHAIAPYGTTMAGLPSQIAYSDWQKNHHAIPSWRHLNLEFLQNTKLKYFTKDAEDVFASAYLECFTGKSAIKVKKLTRYYNPT